MLDKKHLQNFGLQFITHSPVARECVEQAEAVLRGGCLWVQLRMKDADADTLIDTAKRIAPMCKDAGATFIVDDNIDACLAANADGVHLGKNDTHPSVARQMLGANKIIGGTCNTAEDVISIAPYVDYVGCGPFKFTTTKKNLSPVLGLDGYRNLTWQVRSNGVNVPIVAIGGITVADIDDILSCGPNGIALSGEIIRSADMTQKTAEIIDKINRHNK